MKQRSFVLFRIQGRERERRMVPPSAAGHWENTCSGLNDTKKNDWQVRWDESLTDSDQYWSIVLYFVKLPTMIVRIMCGCFVRCRKPCRTNASDTVRTFACPWSKQNRFEVVSSLSRSVFSSSFSRHSNLAFLSVSIDRYRSSFSRRIQEQRSKLRWRAHCHIDSLIQECTVSLWAAVSLWSMMVTDGSGIPGSTLAAYLPSRRFYRRFYRAPRSAAHRSFILCESYAAELDINHAAAIFLDIESIKTE